MITLWPRLPAAAAESLVEEYLSDELENRREFNAHSLPDAVRFSSTGGSPIASVELVKIRDEIMNIAIRNGYGRKGTRSEFSNFDYQTASWLAEQHNFESGEALRDDVWAFIAIVLLPDIAYWRFGKSPERYFGGVRNTFQRLWLRGKIFDRGESSTDRWKILAELTEDAFVQIVERPSISGNPVLALAIGEAWIRASAHHGKGAMEDVTRRAIPQIRVRNEVRCLDELDISELEALLDEAFETSSTTAVNTGTSESSYQPSSSRDSATDNLPQAVDIVEAAKKLEEMAQRWGLLSPKSSAALKVIALNNTSLTSSERNSLLYLMDRVEDIGLIEYEITLLRSAFQ